MATLAGLAALLLSMGQDSPAKPLLVGLAAGASIWVTDVRGWLCLNRTMASAVALLLVAYFALHLARADGEARLLVLADLIVCLQVVLFFRKKDRSIYWQLAIISLLEVVVAAIFSHGAMFGIVLVFYMMTGLSALALSVLVLAREPVSRRRVAAAAGVCGRQPLAAARRPVRVHGQFGRQQPGRRRRRVVPTAGHAGDGDADADPGDFLYRAAAGSPGVARRHAAAQVPRRLHRHGQTGPIG